MGPSLRMGAICIWILNALIFRPGDQRWDKDLVEGCAAYEVEDEADEVYDEDDMRTLIAEDKARPMLEIRGCYLYLFFVGG